MCLDDDREDLLSRVKQQCYDLDLGTNLERQGTYMYTGKELDLLPSKENKV